jgi:hypothetical protein
VAKRSNNKWSEDEDRRLTEMRDAGESSDRCGVEMDD